MLFGNEFSGLKNLGSGLVVKTSILVVALLVGASAISSGASASLDAIAFNSNAQSISSGTLKLEASESGTGFTAAISNLAPGDTSTRFVNYTNSGTLAGRALTIQAVDSTTSPTLLTTSATKGLFVTVTLCGGGSWNSSTGACSGTPSVLLVATPITTVISTAQSLVAGALTSGEVVALKFEIVLPDQTETTTNGVLPASPIQNLSALIQFRLREVQRAAVVTNA